MKRINDYKDMSRLFPTSLNRPKSKSRRQIKRLVAMRVACLETTRHIESVQETIDGLKNEEVDMTSEYNAF